MTNRTTLYSGTDLHKMRKWSIHVEGDKYIVEHGQCGGRIQQKTTKCSPKNVGRSNETTAEQQAIIEMEARIVKQLKKGYYRTKEEALMHVDNTPMLAKNFVDQSDKVVYPTIVQEKLDGLRMLTDVSNELCFSKSGEDYNVFLPEHIQKELKILEEQGLQWLDGEIYTPRLSLQKINSAFRKPNEDTPLLEYWIYDIPSDDNQLKRWNTLKLLQGFFDSLGIVSIKVHLGFIAKTPEEATAYFEHCKEGIVYRNLRGVYEFGKRSQWLIKRKHRETTEAFVTNATVDKNNQAVLGCVLQSGVEFECLMLKDADPDVNLRLYENRDRVIGKYIEIEFETYSDKGVPTKPVGLRIRNVGFDWKVLD